MITSTVCCVAHGLFSSAQISIVADPRQRRSMSTCVAAIFHVKSSPRVSWPTTLQRHPKRSPVAPSSMTSVANKSCSSIGCNIKETPGKRTSSEPNNPPTSKVFAEPSYGLLSIVAEKSNAVESVTCSFNSMCRFVVKTASPGTYAPSSASGQLP